MKDKIKWAYKILRCHAYIIATDEEAVVSIPYIDPYSFENMFFIQAQRSAIKQIKENLNEVIKEHDRRIKQLSKEK